MGTWLFQAVNCRVIQVGYSQNSSLQSHIVVEKAKIPFADIFVDPINVFHFWTHHHSQTVIRIFSYSTLSPRLGVFILQLKKKHNLRDFINYYQLFKLKKILGWQGTTHGQPNTANPTLLLSQDETEKPQGCPLHPREIRPFKNQS